MKKLILIIILITFIFCLTGCSREEKEKNRLIEISYSKFKEKLEDKETFFIEIMQTGCSACKSFAPKYKEVLEEYNLISYQLNFTNMTKEDYEEFNDNYDVKGTPTVIFITEGSEKSELQRITANIAKSKIIAKMKANGIIE